MHRILWLAFLAYLLIAIVVPSIAQNEANTTPEQEVEPAPAEFVSKYETLTALTSIASSMETEHPEINDYLIILRRINSIRAELVEAADGRLYDPERKGFTRQETPDQADAQAE